MSSYALEVMVLYVLLHYHERARTPLTLLRTFLDVLSQFDWSVHALSLQGPVPLATLSEGPVAHQSGALRAAMPCAAPLLWGRRARAAVATFASESL